jgi:subtilisin family serine protease
MGSIDPQIQIMMQQSYGLADTSVASLTDDLSAASVSSTTPSPLVRLLLHFTDNLSQVVEQAGFRVTSVAGDVAAGFVALKDVERLAAMKNVLHIELSRPLVHELDLSLVEARVEQLHNAVPPRRGSGVILGLVDTGVNVAHKCFCTTDEATGTTRTRIRAIWDQLLTPLAADQPPLPFGYGVEYGPDAINEALAILAGGGNPADGFRHPGGQHGTHVVGIAAGNGSITGTVIDPRGKDFLLDERGYEGIASEADIVVVRYNREGFMAGSAYMLDALSYIFKVAERAGLPAVVNISQGDSVGAHDGTSLLERAIDNLLGGPGRVIVKSAGNLGLESSHATGIVPPLGKLDLPIEVNKDVEGTCTFDIWYSGGDLFGVAIISPPDNERSNVIQPGPSPVSFTLPNGNRVELMSSTNSPYNGDNRIFIQIRAGQQKSVVSGPWTIVLSSVKVTDGRFHAWIDTPQLENNRSSHPRFLGSVVSPECTITIPGTSRKIITVSAYMTKRGGEEIDSGRFAVLSSLGPSRDVSRTGPKPDIAAPGQNIISALNNPNDKKQYLVNGGTSAAAAHVSGAAALLLAENPRLTQEQVKDLLCRHASIDEFTDAPPGSNGWGAGKLNVKAAHDALLAQS